MSSNKKQSARPRSRPLSSFDMKPLTWLWPGRIPAGKLTLFSGDPGLGKGTVMADLVARATTGRLMPGSGEDDSARPGDAILICAEDGVEDTIFPRVMAAAGDPDRVRILDGAETAGPKSQFQGISIQDVDVISQAVNQSSNPRLLVVDPVSAFMGGVDSHNNTDVRGALQPLSELAERTGVAIILVSHLNKSKGGNSAYRTMGSLAFVAASRAAYVVAKDKKDPDRRLLLPVKANLGPDRGGLAYRLIPTSVPSGAGEIEVCRVEWEEGVVNISADDALSDSEARKADAVDEAALDLVSDLFEGRIHVVWEEVWQHAQAAGISKARARAALSCLGAVSRPLGFQEGWAYRLPGDHDVAG